MKTYQIEDVGEIERIMDTCDICYVGITDLEGNPYVIPMNFGYQDGVLYLHSGPTGSCIDMLEKNRRICVTFCTDRELTCQHPKMACSYRMKAKSIVCRGDVVFLPDNDLEEKRKALDILMHHYTDQPCGYSDPAVRNVKVWKVKVDRFTAREYASPSK